MNLFFVNFLTNFGLVLDPPRGWTGAKPGGVLLEHPPCRGVAMMSQDALKKPRCSKTCPKWYQDRPKLPSNHRLQATG